MLADKIRWLQFPAAEVAKEDIYDPYSYEKTAPVRRCHESLEAYAVTPLVSLSGLASAIGAVNTVYHRDGKLIGTNTDLYGFLYMLREAGIAKITPPEHINCFFRRVE